MRSLSNIWAVIMVLVVGGLIPAGHEAVELLLDDDTSMQQRGTALELVAEPSSLAKTYDLPVVNVPQPPPFVSVPVGQSIAAAPQSICPVTVRAIVLAENVMDSFVVVAREHEATLLHPGEVLRTSAGRFLLFDLDENFLVFKRGQTRIRCELGR